MKPIIKSLTPKEPLNTILTGHDLKKWENEVSSNDLLLKIAIGVLTLVINICCVHLYYL